MPDQSPHALKMFKDVMTAINGVSASIGKSNSLLQNFDLNTSIQKGVNNWLKEPAVDPRDIKIKLPYIYLDNIFTTTCQFEYY